MSRHTLLFSLIFLGGWVQSQRRRSTSSFTDVSRHQLRLHCTFHRVLYVNARPQATSRRKTYATTYCWKTVTEPFKNYELPLNYLRTENVSNDAVIRDYFDVLSPVSVVKNYRSLCSITGQDSGLALSSKTLITVTLS
jgi:hypothetical protein